jgi:ABC-2 type transport system permease protein
MTRRERLFPNVWLVAKREYLELVRRRVFRVSTIALAAVAVGIAFLPVIFRAVDQVTVTRIGVTATDQGLATTSQAILDAVLNGGFTGQRRDQPAYELEVMPDRATATSAVEAGQIDAALLAERQTTGGLEFEFVTGETVGADRAQLVAVGALAVAVLDWNGRQGDRTDQFVVPSFDSVSAAGPTSGGEPINPAEYAGRRIVGIVFVVMMFITLIIYGLWVATGVASEKSTRVMELLVSAASAPQLVIGKVFGIGLAGGTQYLAVLVPAIVALLFQ